MEKTTCLLSADLVGALCVNSLCCLLIFAILTAIAILRKSSKTPGRNIYII